MAAPKKLHVAVVGAGSFGGWTALALLRRGVRVTLFDAWGPGNSRSSSGGESRVIRGLYGADRLYAEWVARSFPRWREVEAGSGIRLFHPSGCLWMCGDDDAYARASLPVLAEVGLPATELSVAEARRRWPQIDFSGVSSLFFEGHAGSLLARRACRVVWEAVAAQGGEVRLAAVRPGPLAEGRMTGLTLPDGTVFPADAFVFACGPWLGRLFPEEVGERILPTRQEVFFFGPPEGDSRFDEGSCPIWMDMSGERIYYGIPGTESRGFKLADDTRGAPIDPTTDDRIPTPARLAEAREFLARRFPALANAPLVESRVCQYENTPDGQLLIDRHPAAGNVWLAGGGSGHGFKLGPAVGEHVADLVLDGHSTLPPLRLAHRAPGEMLQNQFTAGKG